MSFSEVKDEVFNKYSIKRVNTKSSFWYFFGIGKNPYDDALTEIYEKDPQDALGEDWAAISGDFNKAVNEELES